VVAVVVLQPKDNRPEAGVLLVVQHRNASLILSASLPHPVISSGLTADQPIPKI
jgi:hypothetical protein